MFKYVSLLPIDALYSGIYLYIIKKSAAIRIIKNDIIYELKYKSQR